RGLLSGVRVGRLVAHLAPLPCISLVVRAQSLREPARRPGSDALTGRPRRSVADILAQPVSLHNMGIPGSTGRPRFVPAAKVSTVDAGNLGWSVPIMRNRVQRRSG